MTVSFNGIRITEAESTNGWTAVGGPDQTLETDFVKQGTYSIAKQVSGAGGLEWNIFDVTTSTDFSVGLDFGAGGAQEGQVIFIWGYCTTPTLIDTKENGGLRVYLGISSANCNVYYVDGSNTYPSGWVKYVIDPTKPPSAIAGTGGTSSNVQYIGMGALTTGSVKANNLAIDAIEVGYGMQVTGSATDGWQDILDYDAVSTNQYGIFRESSGVVFGRGQLQVGTSASDCQWEDRGRQIIWENPTYYLTSDAAMRSCISTNFYRVVYASPATPQTTVYEGIKVGDSDGASGRAGVSYISSGPPLALDASDTDIGSFRVFGNLYRGLTGGMTLPELASSDNEFAGVTISQSGQMNSGGAVLRNGIFANNDTDATAALLWSSSINIKNYQFLACQDGIEHPATATDVAYDNLTFSGNDYDINWTGPATTDAQLLINAQNGANPASVRENAGSTDWAIDNPVFYTINGLINASTVQIVSTDEATVYYSDTDVSGGTTQYPYNYTSDRNAIILVTNINYLSFDQEVTLGAADATLPVSQVLDPTYNNP